MPVIRLSHSNIIDLRLLIRSLSPALERVTSAASVTCATYPAVATVLVNTQIEGSEWKMDCGGARKLFEGRGATGSELDSHQGGVRTIPNHDSNSYTRAKIFQEGRAGPAIS